MCCFDSPVRRCEAIHEMVLTDETQAECAREHGCPPGRVCPLQGCFADQSGIADAETEMELKALHPSLPRSHRTPSGRWSRRPSASTKN